MNWVFLAMWLDHQSHIFTPPEGCDGGSLMEQRDILETLNADTKTVDAEWQEIHYVDCLPQIYFVQQKRQLADGSYEYRAVQKTWNPCSDTPISR